MPYKSSPLNPNTRYQYVQGIRQRGAKMYRCKICVRVTHDKHGKSLSLEDGERMLMIPLEEVTDMIDVTF